MTENSRNQREMAQLTELHSERRETFSENEMIRGMQGRKPGTVQVWMPAAPFQTIAGLPENLPSTSSWRTTKGHGASHLLWSSGSSLEIEERKTTG